jgi:hypothetical protein
MSDQTSLLGLPYILPTQTQKHVTRNEALRRLDALVRLAVANRNLTAPPVDPAECDRHIVAAGATDGWSDKDDRIASFQDGAWAFLTPRAGWFASVADEAELVFWDETTWRPIENTLSELQNISLLGVGTTADTANPFAAKLNKALWSAGDDSLHIKVSADGGAWRESLLADATIGSVGFPSGLVHAASGAPLNGVLFTPVGDVTVSIWRLDAAHAQNPRSATIMSKITNKFSLEVRQRAVRLVFGSRARTYLSLGSDYVDLVQNRLHGSDAVGSQINGSVAPQIRYSRMARIIWSVSGLKMYDHTFRSPV